MRTTTVHSDSISSGIRLDAKYYLSPGVHARTVILELKLRGTTCILLGTADGAARIWAPERFKHCYASPYEESVAYLRPYDVFKYLPASSTRLSKVRSTDIDSLLVPRGTILQTRSGRNLGPSVIVDGYLSAFAHGNDIFRIAIEDEELSWYIFAFLNSAIGQSLLRRGKSGSVIDHLNLGHLQSQEIPVLDVKIRARVSAMVRHAFEAREHARLSLVRLEQEYLRSFPVPERGADLKSGWTVSPARARHRIDAAFHDPLVQEIRSNLLQAGGVPVSKIAKVLKPGGRHKTKYVSQELGPPYLSGRQILQHRPVNLRHLSPSSIFDIDHFTLRPNWILYQADGRVQTDLGEPVMSTRSRDGWLASGHIGRVIPNNPEHAAWLYLALRTPHCQLQLKSMASGSVVDSTFEADMESVIVPPNLVRSPEVIAAWGLLSEADELDQESFATIDREFAAIAQS